MIKKYNKVIFLLAIGLWMVCSCSIFDNMHNFKNQYAENKSDQEIFKRATKAFSSKNYKEAAIIFHLLQKQTKNIELKRKALYGQACARMIIADTPDAFKNALSLWNSWRQMSDHRKGCEDPGWLDILILRGAPMEPLKQSEAQEAGYVEKIPQKDTSLLKPNVDENLELNLKKQLQIKNKEIRMLNKKIISFKVQTKILAEQSEQIKALEEEIQLLKHQITTIEAIDQNIQQKKKQISAPK